MAPLKHVYVFFLAVLYFSLHSQSPINCFANVTNISGNVLTVNNVNETYHTFEDGDYIVIMQMQDNVIGTNTTNASSFGDLGSIQSAGLFEIARIGSHTEVSSLPNTITLTASLVNSYHINSNASLQIISFRFLGANFTTTANIGTLAWNGTVGGVTAFYVTNTLTLAHNITANGCGFTGGSKNSPDGYTACDNSTYITAIATRYAGKGTGIYKNTTTGYAGARGKILNGGGGGNDVNSGGGGGGNYTSGGGGGSGWTSSGSGCSPIAGGLGGLSLSSSIGGNRVFMGGGGGGGHENDGVGTAGANGGGIILIKATTLLTSGSCGGLSISANGNTAGNASNDGAGGGGVGGSIILNVTNFNVASTCVLTVSANGGNGGNSNASSTGAHGGGGGGGQGAVIYPSSQPTSNITTNTIPGTGGVSCSGCSASVNGSTGSGTNNSGIITSASGPLPIDLLSFQARVNEMRQVVLEWSTAMESNSKEFILQRMGDDLEIRDLAYITPRGSNSHYRFIDPAPLQGISYYRLNEISTDLRSSPKNWVEVDLGAQQAGEIFMYPNPLSASQQVTVYYYGPNSADLKLELLDSASGAHLGTGSVNEEGHYTFATGALNPGVYILKASVGGKTFFKKLIVLQSTN